MLQLNRNGGRGKAMPDTVPQLLTLRDVANRLRVSPHTVRSWMRKGKLRPVRICRRLLFHPDEVARFLAAASDSHFVNAHEGQPRSLALTSG